MRFTRVLLATGMLAAVAALPPAPNAHATSPPTPGQAFHAVGPVRVVDTRESGQRLAAGGVLNVAITGHYGVPAGPAQASAVVTITAVNADTAGYITAWPAGENRPETSIANPSGPGSVIAATTFVRLGADGSFNLFSNVATDLVVDISGYFAYPTFRAGDYGSGLVPLQPQRLTDSRTTAVTPLPAGTTNTFDTGPLGVPAEAVAIVANITTVGAQSAGFVTAWPAGTPRPHTSMLNAAPSGTSSAVSNFAVIPLSGGMFSIFNSFDGDIVIDVSGYFDGDSGYGKASSSLYIATGPHRTLDTRAGSGTAAKPGATVTMPEISEYSSAIVFTMTVTNAAGPSYVTAWASPDSPPPVASANTPESGATVANTTIVGRAGDKGTIFEPPNVFLSGGGHLIIDEIGYFLQRT